VFPLLQVHTDQFEIVIQLEFMRSPEFHRQTHALRYSDSDINRIYEQERNLEIAQLKIILKRNVNLTNQDDLFTAAIVMHNLIESAIHTYMFLGPNVKKDNLVQQLSMVVLNYFQVYEQQTKEKSIDAS